MFAIAPALFRLCFLLAFAALSACAPKNTYSQPPELNRSNGATIHGFRQASSSLLGDDFYVYMVKMDNLFAGNGISGWDEPVIVSPGSHRIDFGVAAGRNAWGFGLGIYSLETGKDYYLKGAMPTAKTGPDSLFYGWIETADGRRMGERIAVDVRPATRSVTPIFLFLK